MAGTINNTLITSSYTLTAAYTTITNTGTVAVPSGTAVNGGIGATWTVANAGSISALGNTGIGMYLVGGGTVTNAANASINVGDHGIQFGFDTGTGTVINEGTIAASIGASVYFGNDGVVCNGTTGFITGANVGVINENGITTVVNKGSITGGHIGVYIGFGGTITNAASASITGGLQGIRLEGALGTINNAGTIAGTFGEGIAVGYAGLITNAAGASITGGDNGSVIRFVGGAGTIDNNGTISGTGGAGIYLLTGGTVTNLASASLLGGSLGGVYIKGAAGTVDNGGTIAGDHSTGIDITLPSGFANRVIDRPGAVFSGTVSGGNTIGASTVSTLELAAAGVGAGTLTGLGTEFIGFASVAVDADAAWTIGGTAAGLSAGETISGFSALDTLDISDIAATGSLAAGLGAHNVLDVTQNGGTIATIQLDPAQDFTGQHFLPGSDGGSGIAITMACFAAGTRIATGDGEVAVEELQEGQMVRSAFGGLAPVVWIGHRRVDCYRHPRPHDVWPVRIAVDAFGPSQPSRDLLLSPDHAIYHDGALIPVRYLVNGATVAHERRDSVTYYHVELPSHDVLLAEGLPAESFLDTGNRGAFANAPAPAQVDLLPDFALRVWETASCAPLTIDGPGLLACRRTLLDRARAFGHVVIGDPDLTVLADERPLAMQVVDHVWRARLPSGTRRLRLLSRRWVPAQVNFDNSDHRVLGVALAELKLDSDPVGPHDRRCGKGWHLPEDALRWTDGDAVLLPGGARTLSFRIVLTGRYWLDDARGSDRRRA